MSIETPFSKINNAVRASHPDKGFHAGDVVVVAARPKDGKTSMLCSIGAHAALNGFNVIHMTSDFELSPSEVMLKYSDFLPNEVDGSLFSDTYRTLSPDLVFFDVLGVVSRAAFQTDMLIVDPIPRISTSLAFCALQRVGAALGCPVFTSTQLRRNGDFDSGSSKESSREGPGEAPWATAAMATAVIEIHRPEDLRMHNRAEVSVPVNRYGPSVSPFVVDVDPKTGRISDV